MSETVALTQGLPGHIRPGLVIAGKYRLEQEIGRGSMGTVYRAQHVSLGTRFAIKLISAEHSQSQEARRRFSVEAKAAAKLRSRHVVQVYDDGETPEGNPYIVLEYLDGETLEQRIEREHDIPLADAVRIASHVGRALARAHAQGIVHRDLKPANVFLVRTDDDDDGWLAKVLDFGIAKVESHADSGTTQAGTVLGTPLFMSPEQVRGASSVDHRADLYSLGMCLYHMLTGEFAYYYPNYSDILIGICTQPLPQLRAKAPWAPAAVEQWFQRACAKEPLERFQSADEMIEALSAAAGAPTLSKHKSVPEGRIAPETLMGYAAPALATLHPESKAVVPSSLAGANLAATSVLPAPPVSPAGLLAATRTSPGHALPSASQPYGAPPVAIAVGGGRSTLPEDEWQPPTHSLRPLWVGVGLGLLAVATVGVTLAWLGKSKSAATSATASSATATQPPAAREVSVPGQLVSPAPPTLAVEAAPMPSPAAEHDSVAVDGGSSVAAERSRSAPAKSKPKRAITPRSAPATAKPHGSDLGF